MSEMSPHLYTLILERTSPRPLAEMARVLASNLSVTRVDAAARLRYGGGCVAEDLSEDVADRLSRDLDGLGVRTRRIEAERWAVISPGYAITALELLDDTILARLLSEKDLVIPREDLFGMDVHGMIRPREAPEATRGRIPSARSGARPRAASTGIEAALKAPAAESGTQSFRLDLPHLTASGQQLLENLAAFAEEGDVELRLTLFCADPTGPLRIRRDRFDYSCLGHLKRGHSVDNFLGLIELILSRFPDVWNREPAERFLQDLDPAPLLRFKEEEVHGFERWILQWRRLELEERSAPRPEGGPGT